MMATPFNADEIFEIAEQIERNGGRFYRAAAKKFPAVRELLLRLAEMEDDHEKTFADMRTAYSGKEAAPPVFDPDGEAQMYLRAMADGHIFSPKVDPVEQVAGNDTPEEILQMALGVERDSIAFYIGLKRSVPEPAGKDKVEAIIKEEISHVAILSEELEKLAGQG
ncbi:MAG: ferritin family protein [Planctomycetota bacterium]